MATTKSKQLAVWPKRLSFGAADVMACRDRLPNAVAKIWDCWL